MRARAVGVQVTPTEFRFLLLAACYREDTPNGVWTITPTEVGGDTVSPLVGLHRNTGVIDFLSSLLELDVTECSCPTR